MCYKIDWKQKRCYYGSKEYYKSEDIDIVISKFHINEFGKYQLEE